MNLSPHPIRSAVGGFLILLATSLSTYGEAKLSNCQDFVANHPAMAKALVAALDLNHSGLESVKTAEEKGDRKAASEALLAYFQSNPAGAPFRPINWNSFRNWDADEMLKDVYSVQGVKDTMPRREDGFLKWNHIPKGGDLQYGALLSRFGHIDIALRRYKETGDREYLEYAYANTADFILGNPVPQPVAGKQMNAEMFKGNQVWLTLNAALRLRSFIKIFYTLQQIEPRNDAGLLLLLSSISEHAEFLQCHGGEGSSNWSTTEMESLLQVAVAFPEFNGSKAWANRASTRYAEILTQAIYPDGAQQELATGYGVIGMNSSVGMYHMLNEAGLNIPEQLVDSIRSQISHYAWTMDPAGSVLAHGDTDNQRGKLRESITELAREFAVPEALYIATDGREGTAPQNPPSRFFNWSGFGVSRDTCNKTSQWSVFNAGPYGIGHYHMDKLSIVLYNKREILVDPGRYSYSSSGGWVDQYFHSTRGHNTIAIDGFDQYTPGWQEDKGLPEEERNHKYNLRSVEPLGENEKAVLTPEADFFLGRTYTGYRKGANGPRMPGDAVHERAIHYQRGKFWVVVDRITSNQPRKLEAFWHFHPGCQKVEVLADGSVATLDANQGNLLILPIEGSVRLNGALYKGQEKPFKQGWFSEAMNQKEPSYDAVYTGKAQEKSYFGWLLIPFEGDQAPKAQAKLAMNHNAAEVIVEINGETTRCSLPLAESPKLKTYP